MEMIGMMPGVEAICLLPGAHDGMMEIFKQNDGVGIGVGVVAEVLNRWT